MMGPRSETDGPHAKLCLIYITNPALGGENKYLGGHLPGWKQPFSSFPDLIQFTKLTLLSEGEVGKICGGAVWWNYLHFPN